MIITEINELKIPCENVSSIEEGEDIAVKLFNELTQSGDGIGLAANQIGINKKVCIINVLEDPVILINPLVLEGEGEIYMEESCLSFPNKTSKTKRYQYITIECDNLGKVMFGPTGNIEDSYTEGQQLQLLESICVQHEIDHLYGVTMFDRMHKIQPLISDKKYGRNERVTITDGTDTKTIKWKKAKALVDDGEWDIVIKS
ncbi:MAG: peptide deformylase [Candidatus Pelagibacter sp.]|nr:peptide deformylase [Candidatus Pelagibacter sp.]